MTVPDPSDRRTEEHDLPMSRRSVLKTGAFASGTAISGVSTGRAVAQGQGDGRLQTRTTVVDREDPDPDPAIVLAELDLSLDEWIVYGNETVAYQNPGYDPDQAVVIVTYEDDLDTHWPGWQQTKPDAILDGVIERGIKFYAFPRARLERPRSKGSAGIQAGAIVIDREDPESDPAVVLTAPDVPISDWIVYANETVADQNPGYEPGDPVIVVSYEHDLDAAWPDWQQTNPRARFDEVVDRGIKFYAFPLTRLERHRSRKP